MTESDLLYSKKPVVYLAGEDRRVHKNNMPADITDQNINGRITKWGGANRFKISLRPGKN